MIICVLQLAELKSVFDRFAVDGLMTAPETCQALTEAGLVVPRRCAVWSYWFYSVVLMCDLIRREIAQYMRSRKHLGVTRSITFFEFMRAYAAIR